MRIAKALLCIVVLGGLALAQEPKVPVPVTPMKEPTLSLSQLENRLTDLQKAEAQAEQAAQQAQANVHAYQGAIAETQNWIKQLEDSALPKVPAKK